MEEIILAPILTEKSQKLREKGIYVFKVLKRANKVEIKKAIEKIFNVKVAKVTTINVPRKKRTRGRIFGFKPSYKKAMVKLAKGEKIEF